MSAVLAVVIAAALPGSAHAFSAPTSYMDPVDLGGGAGRWFTGSPADGYGCNACHQGAAGVELSVTGLPTTGFVPGMSYEVKVTWPPQVLNVALIAEFSDELRQGAGVVALPRPDVTPVTERCTGEEEGFPSSEIVEADAGRMLISVIDCGARMLRFQWTAPVVIPGRVWFNAGFVVSNDDAAPGGDGVTLVSMPLAVAGSSAATRTIAQSGCSVARPIGRAGSALPVFTLLCLALVRRRRRQRTRAIAMKDEEVGR